MNATRASLQRQFFQERDERLSAFVRIVKVDGRKKKRPSLLCITLSSEHPISVRLYVVKCEKDETYRQKEVFQLRDIRHVDGINPRKPSPDFHLAVGDQPLRFFVAATAEEKDSFICQLFNLSRKYCPAQMPEFTNVPIPVDEPEIVVPVETRDDEENDTVSGYQPISAKEEADFRRLLSKTELKIDQADLFAKVLTEQLQSLDGANIQSMMGSEAAVNNLLVLLDGALGKCNELEREIDGCDEILVAVRDSVELIEEKDSLSLVERKNKERLTKETKDFLASLDVLSERHLAVLREANISDPASITRVVEAALAVSRFVNGAIPKPLLRMKAYKQKSSKLEVLDLFVDKLVSHLAALFDNLSDASDSNDWHQLSIPKQSQRHRALAPLADLMGWLKNDRSRERVYQADSSFKDSPNGGGPQLSLPNIIETVLGELSTVIVNEQKFCVRFFHINSELHLQAETFSHDSGDSTGVRNADRHMNEQLRHMMSPLFDSLNPNLDRFTKACCRNNRMNILLLFVIMSKKVMQQSETTEAGSYYAVTFGTLVVLIKRQFDTFMESESQELANVRIAKRMRVGILPSLEKFASVIRKSEQMFEGAERRTDLEKWYDHLERSVCQGIEAAARSPNSKSPSSVVRFENYHQLYLTLSELKINSLNNQRKEAKRRKEESIEAYVQEHMGRPLEKIQVFFENVSRTIESGTRPEEISYQPQFSKMELKKVISQYPGKEVRKGLEQLYKKVEKHLVDNSSLLQVVWRSMQENFIAQIQDYQQRIASCYPGSKLELEFTLQDVLSYFSEIAQSH